MVSDRRDTSEQDSSPTENLDEVVHQRVRLGILTIAHESRKVEFRFLQETLGLTPGNLSQHIRVLEDARLIVVEKGSEGRRPRTWVAITKAGKSALRQEIAALRAIVSRVDEADGTRT
jgi:DNA-binding MarR family transcriptional regulator